MQEQKKVQLHGFKILRSIQQQHFEWQELTVSKDPEYFTRLTDTANTSARNLPLKQWPEVQSLKDHCKETRKLAVLLVWLCECTIKMSPVPVCMAVTRVKWLWHGIIITPFTSAHAISFRPIATETREQFYTHFEQGQSPSSSVHHHSLNLAIKYEGRELQYQTAIANRSINPLPKDIYYLYHKWRSEKHGKENGETMFNQLMKIMEEYNKENAEIGGRAFL